MVINETAVQIATNLSVSGVVSSTVGTLQEKLTKLAVITFIKFGITLLGAVGMRVAPHPYIKMALAVITAIFAISTLITAIELFQVLLSIVTSTL